MTAPTERPTLRQIAEKAVEIAKAQPDHIDDSGSEYFTGLAFDDEGEATDPDGREPGCLFGHVFAAFGFNAGSLQEEDSTVDWALEGMNFPVFLPSADPAAQDWDPLVVAMKEAQERQDLKDPWGDAVEPIIEVLASNG